MKRFPEEEKHGMLIFDDMATRERVKLNSKTMTYEGLVDHGEGFRNAQSPTETANKGLVFMYQPLGNTYKAQPISFFAIKNCTGAELTRLIMKAIILLEQCDLKIHGVISDGGGPNRRFWSEVGVSGKMTDTKTPILWTQSGKYSFSRTFLIS